SRWADGAPATPPTSPPPFAIVLAWLLGVRPSLVAIPGASRAEDARPPRARPAIEAQRAGSCYPPRDDAHRLPLRLRLALCVPGVDADPCAGRARGSERRAGAHPVRRAPEPPRAQGAGGGAR